MPVGERAQERPQRRRCTHPGEQPRHPTEARQVQVVDAVHAGEHPADHRGGPGPGARRRHRQPAQQVVQAGGLGQPQHRHQPGNRHHTRIIEDWPDHARSHSRDAPAGRADDDVAITIVPSQERILVQHHAHPVTHDRWIQAEPRDVSDEWTPCGKERVPSDGPYPRTVDTGCDYAAVCSASATDAKSSNNSVTIAQAQTLGVHRG